MTWQDVAMAFELVLLVGLYLDDHKMRKLAEESLAVSRDSLQAQKDYLVIRRKWYESRGKKKSDEPKPI